MTNPGDDQTDALGIAPAGRVPFSDLFGSPASEQSAHYAANQSTWTAIAAVMVSTTPTVTTGQTSFIGFVTAAGAGVRR